MISGKTPYWVQVLQILSAYSNLDTEMIAPNTTTQEGVAAAAGIIRPHATGILNRLEEDGLVGRNLAHIQGVDGRRRYAYHITPQGLAAIKSWNSKRVLETPQKILVDPNDVTTLRQLLAKAESKRSIGVEIAGIGAIVGIGIALAWIWKRGDDGL